MQLTVQLAGLLALAGSCLALEDFALRLSNQPYCFPIKIHTSAENAKLSAKVTKYEVSPKFLEIEDRNDTHVLVTAYRKIHVNDQQHFMGEYAPLIVCSDEAIKNGYCKEKHRGKLLFEYKDPETHDGLITNEIINDMELHENFFTTNESGVYCVKAYAPWGESFKLDIQVEDGHKQKISFRRKQWGLIWENIIISVPILIFTALWISWAQNQPIGLNAIPYSVKIMLINGIFALIENIIKQPLFIGLSGNLNLTIYLLWSSYWLWMNSFIPYQWSGNFSHGKITDFEGIKTFFFIQLLFIMIFVLELLQSNYPELTKTTTFDLILGGLHALEFLIQYLYLNFKVFQRYRSTTKEFKDFNKSGSPIYKQFTWFFLSEYIGIPSSHFLGMILFLIMMHGLPNIPAYRDNYMLDGEEHFYSDLPIDIALVYIALWKGYVLLKYWTPSYFHQLETYKEREE
ncbi:CYFA0S27e00672g1_1 [Cyberlindnera fabianii]|uniref:CYFA0S27e00672g1_1 n=1 Tax=Cyberlindnera fabianii TaxID=36022 RepID=A0A061BJ48_CYBFA|nr:CYFA0S27e00672g1_1 [Cyberlindnera fabianii]